MYRVSHMVLSHLFWSRYCFVARSVHSDRLLQEVLRRLQIEFDRFEPTCSGSLAARPVLTTSGDYHTCIPHSYFCFTTPQLLTKAPRTACRCGWYVPLQNHTPLWATIVPHPWTAGINRGSTTTTPPPAEQPLQTVLGLQMSALQHRQRPKMLTLHGDNHLTVL